MYVCYGRGGQVAFPSNSHDINFQITLTYESTPYSLPTLASHHIVCLSACQDQNTGNIVNICWYITVGSRNAFKKHTYWCNLLSTRTHYAAFSPTPFQYSKFHVQWSNVILTHAWIKGELSSEHVKLGIFQATQQGVPSPKNSTSCEILRDIHG